MMADDVYAGDGCGRGNRNSNRRSRARRMLAWTMIAAAGMLASLSSASAAPAGGDAEKALAADLAQMKDVRTLAAHFVCEKRLALLETPLVSTGQLWIRRGDPKNPADAAVRFSTEKPYLSELILVDGKVYARSQHEEDWTRGNQSSRPGLTAVMGQLGGWATGDFGKIAQMYTVAAAPPGDPAIPPTPAGAPELAAHPPKEVDTFILTPSNKDLAQAVKQITLSLNHADGGLLYIAIETQQGDTTRYWFGDVQRNADLPANIFEPTDKSPLPKG